VFRDQGVEQALREPEAVGGTLPAARVVGPVSAQAFDELARRTDGDRVAFADPALELQWTRRVLGFGDAR